MNKSILYTLVAVAVSFSLALGYYMPLSNASETGPCGAKYTVYVTAAGAVEDAIKARNTAYRTYLLSPPLPNPLGWMSAAAALKDAIDLVNRKIGDLEAAKKAYEDCKKSHESQSQQPQGSHTKPDYNADPSQAPHLDPPEDSGPGDEQGGPNSDDEDGSPNTNDVDGAPNTDDDDGSPNTNDGDGGPNTNDGDGSPNTDDDDGGPNTNDGDGSPNTEDDEHGSANIPLPPPPF